MALFQVSYSSQALQSQCGAYIVLPASGKPFRVVYLLHGYSGNHTDWVRLTGIVRYAEERRVMVVMPDGANAFYTDARGYPAKYEQHILETIRFIDDTFATIDSPAGRGIGGLSMGGYGAMKLGLKYPELFGSVASHSGVLDIAAAMRNNPDLQIHGIFGPEVPAEEDCFQLATRPGPKPAIYFDCGDEDFLIEHNRRFTAHLQQLGVEHVYREHPGAHTWEYWDCHVVEALDFHCRQFARLGSGSAASVCEKS